MTARVLHVDADAPDPEIITEAGRVLRDGGTVAFPTETVYGLGAAATVAAAVAKIFAAKRRPADNPLIVHVASLEAAEDVTTRISPLARKLAAQWWPGPLTLVMDAAPGMPSITTGGLTTVGVRVPDHPVARAVIAAAGLPIAAPSANRSGRPSPTTAQHVVDELGDAVDLVIDGGSCTVGLESTVVDARGDAPAILREGAVTREQLGIDGTDLGDVTASPGTRYRHYAPACIVEIVAAGDGPARATALAESGRSVGLIGFCAAGPPVTTIQVVRDAEHLAQRLYDSLRDAERIGIQIVVVEAVPDVGIGRAVMDRLRRAAS